MIMPPAKIQIPRTSVSVIPRPHLVDALQPVRADDRTTAALVCAPAGYGKTTLLALYADRKREEGLPVAWMSCDRHDATSSAFWTSVLAALSAAVRRIPEQAPENDPFESMTPPPTMDRAFLAELCEAVDDVRLPITLVLDDFHEITDSGTLAGVTDFVRNLPDGISLVIGSRRDPALPLHRMRLDGRLREVRGDRLAFDRGEVDRVLRDSGVQLDPADLGLLHGRTEGWPAAVRLAALTLGPEPDQGRFVAQFAGDDTAVAGYLVTEILGRQSPVFQQFLLDTCVCEELTADLAATLSGRSDAGSLLEGLEQANVLVQRTGRSGEWFRYHSLLRTYLLAELRRRDLDAVRARHRTAARWSEQAGLTGRALDHACAAGDEPLLRRLLASYGIRLALIGHGRLVARVIRDSGPAVRDTPDILLLTSILAFEAGDRAVGDQALGRFHARAGSGLVNRRLFEAARLYRARLHGDTDALRELDDIPAPRPGSESDEDVELLVLANRGALRIAAGDYPRADADLNAALELSRRRGCPHLALDCMNQLAGVTGGLSRIEESREWARRTVAFAAEHGWVSSPQLAYSHALAAACAYLMLDLEQAARHTGMSIAVLNGGTIEPEAECAARSAAAVVAFDHPDRRREALRDMGEIWNRLGDFVPSPALTASAHLTEMRMCLTQSDRGHAALVAARAEAMLPGTGDAAVVRAMEQLEHHQPDRARALVAPVIDGRLPTVVVATSILARLIEAVAASRAGMTESAHRAVLAALEIGDRSAVLRPFYDAGPPVRDLLLTTVGRAGRLEAFLARLLAAWKDAEQWQAGTPAVAPGSNGDGHPLVTLPVPLTARELEVLRELPSLLTADEIAEQHQVSVNTVKTHLRSLYRKLGAANRRDAVAHARRMSLL